MDRYWKENHPYPNPNQRQRENPSFSSSLLDSIYRSIDGGVEEIVLYKENMRKKVADEKLVFDRKRDSPVLNSSSSSSNGFSFSSSESESPIRIEKLQGVRRSTLSKINNKQTCQQPKNDLKKKVKQPISPGRRLASFLNSIFTVRTPKKEKKPSSSSSSSSSSSLPSKLAESTCSSVSSFSRSCLSKTPSSRTTLSNGMKRSVRFYPAVSVIVDRGIEQPPPPQPPPSSALRDAIKEEFKLRVMEKNRRVEEAAKDLLKNRYYQKKVEYERFDTKNIGEFDEDDDDDASYSSSDLFELDNLSTIGMERYCEELPVYETTHFDTNRAIAKGFIS